MVQLILNNEGINDNLPKALYLDDLAVKTITSANPKVAAVPPNLTKLSNKLIIDNMCSSFSKSNCCSIFSR